MPKFSVIIPVYNAEKYIDQCVSSLLNQEYTDYELILVNDCSTDHSLELCENYKKNHPNVKVINQSVNRGVSAARNRGIEQAKGEYVLFVDSDDFVTPNYFAIIDDLLHNNKAELYSFGHYDYIVAADNTANIKASFMNYSVSQRDIEPWNKLFLKTFFASPCNKLFLKKILLQNDIRFDESCVCYEDYLFNIEYCKNIDTFISIDTPLYYYRQFTTVNHVNKRKWGERYIISSKVAKNTNELIALKNNIEDLSQIRRYTYKSYLVELEAAKYLNNNYNDALQNLINSNDFFEAVCSIKPCGTKLTIYKAFKYLNFSIGCKYIVQLLI